MSLVYAGITPHPPLLIPNIGKDELSKVEKTKQALKKCEEELYLAKPNIILTISPHGSFFYDAFSVNGFNKFQSDFEQFGDMTTKKSWDGSPDVGSKILQESYSKKIAVRLISQEKIDHGASVPLFYLTEHIPEAKIVPIGFSGLDYKDHLFFGELLKEVIFESNKRFAVIASGDLSHALSDDSPAGFNKAGKEFDEKIIELLETRNTAGIVSLEPKFIEDAAECGYRSILILLGVLKNMDYTFKNLSYEAPFGVGYLTGSFVF